MNALSKVLPVLIVALIWEALPRTGMINPELLPPLSAVGVAWADQIASGELFHHGLWSMRNLAIGFGLGVVGGTVLGILMALRPWIDATAGSLIQLTYPIPRSALIPVMIVWFGLGAGSKIAAIFSGCMLPIVVSAYNGARGVDQMLLWSATGLGASRCALLWEVVLPAAIPEILAGIRNGLATAFILMVTSEFLIGNRGFGSLISLLGDSGDYPSMFGVVLTVAALGFVADRLYLMLMQHLTRWRT